MKDLSNKAVWILAAAIVMLGAAVVAQSIAIYGLKERLQEESSPDTEAEQPAPEEQEPLSFTAPPPLAKAPAMPAPLFDEEWDPFREMEMMRRQIDSMFGDAFDRFSHIDPWADMLGDYSFSPSIDLEDRGDHLLITVDLPGNDSSRLKVDIEDQVLTISGSVKTETSSKDDDGRVLRQERRSGSFERSLMLPVPVDAERMITKEADGVLLIKLPKADGMPAIGA